MESELENLSLHVDQRPVIPPPYPYHMLRVDDGNGLTIKLNFLSDDFHWNYECDNPLTRSFKVFLHRSDEKKRAFDQPYEIEVGKKATVSIWPNIITTTIDARKYDPKVRQCFFNSERKLKFFKVYTRSNCEYECLANFTKKRCGCVKFMMPSNVSFLLLNYKNNSLATEVSCF